MLGCPRNVRGIKPLVEVDVADSLAGDVRCQGSWEEVASQGKEGDQLEDPTSPTAAPGFTCGAFARVGNRHGSGHRALCGGFRTTAHHKLTQSVRTFLFDFFRIHLTMFLSFPSYRNSRPNFCFCGVTAPPSAGLQLQLSANLRPHRENEPKAGSAHAPDSSAFPPTDVAASPSSTRHPLPPQRHLVGGI